jgi:hypothetical protein
MNPGASCNRLLTKGICMGVAAVGLWLNHAVAEEKARPLMRDFMGLNGHTVQFKPELYAPVAKVIRDYHPIKWDVGDDTSFATTFPLARNRVDWSKVYGSWVKAGLRVDACLQFDFEASEWKDMSRDAAVYGEAFAKAFGPSSTALVESAEVGNEPGKYSDAQYRQLFEAMAGGLRKGDPKLRVATCAMNLGTSGRYSKSVDCLKGLESLYDILNIHVYAEIAGWPTWRRGAPEDPETKFIEHLRSVLTWRAENAAEKELWLTEFGWDASSKPAPATGTFAKWEGSTETQQAQWIVRAWMIAARLGLDRAYLYFFNDSDQPSVHASSGLTRNFEPKPAYYAAEWLQRSLGEYRFNRVLREDAGDGWVYEFVHGSEPQKRIVAAWRVSGEKAMATLPVEPKEIVRAMRMPLKMRGEESVLVMIDGETVQMPIGEAPILVWLEGAK